MEAANLPLFSVIFDWRKSQIFTIFPFPELKVVRAWWLWFTAILPSARQTNDYLSALLLLMALKRHSNFLHYSRCCLVLLHIKPKSPNICQGYCRCRRSTSTGLLLNAWRWGVADASGVRDPIQHDFTCSCTICCRGLLCAHQSNQEEPGKTAKPFNTWFLKLNIYCRPTNSVWTWRTLVLFVYKRYKGKLHLHNINQCTICIFFV